MRALLLVMVALFLFVVFGHAGNASVSGTDATDALTTLLRSTIEVFSAVANLFYDIHDQLYHVLDGNLRPLLGLMHCLNLALIVWSIYAIRMLARIRHKLF